MTASCNALRKHPRLSHAQVPRRLGERDVERNQEDDGVPYTEHVPRNILVRCGDAESEHDVVV